VSTDELAAEIVGRCRERIDAGEEVDLDAVVRAHPDVATTLRERFDALARLDRGFARIALDRRGRKDGSVLGQPIRAPLRSLPPERYADFEVAGHGGMGLVYAAVDTELNRRVAFKMVRIHSGAAVEHVPPSPLEATQPEERSPDAAKYEQWKARLVQEAWVQGGLEHPGIVPVYEIGQTPAGIPYYTMRFVRGERTLADAIAEKRNAPYEERLALLEPFLKVCDTLRYAHDKGVVHRDLKPANVALGEYGEVVLLDWGLARLEGREDVASSAWQERVQGMRADTGFRTMEGGSVGTAGYMSPEATLGHLSEVDVRSDVYSLGVILFEILTGRLPFEFGSYAEYASLLLRMDPPAARDVASAVPEALSRVCRRALSREKDSRPASAQELAEAVRSWQAQDAVDREVEALLRDARSALDAAGGLEAEARLHQVDRAAAALTQVEAKRPRSADLPALRGRVETLREEGLRQRERASARRLLRRVAVGGLAAAAVAAFLVVSVVDGKRKEAEDARADAVTAQRATETALGEKTRALDEVLRLADSKKVADLVAEEELLWPVHPDRALAMAEWLARASAVLKNRPEHEAALARLRERAKPSPEADWKQRESWTFEAEQDDWRHQVLADLRKGFDALATTLARVEKRQEVAATLRERSIAERRGAWDATIAAIAASPEYGGLRIVPQLGLVPLGPDPDSGLFEFAHVGSGAMPARDPQTQRLAFADDSAIVLVLVPGGTFRMGAQRADENGPNFDPQAEDDEAPVHEVGLSPCFLGKHEVTQAQWEALTGARPSNYGMGNEHGGRKVTPRHPVEMVSWDECQRWLSRWNLALPTEAQWENGCRGGTDPPWWCGRESRSLERAANLADAFCKAHGGLGGGPYSEELNDGFVFHAPVGSFAANAWGLHDVHGNVWEWCQDTFARYDAGPVTNPSRQGAGDRVSRGASWYSDASEAGSAYRNYTPASFRFIHLGARPARPLLP
jgi:formylglycine-generating enzyme required for sulfatase activity/serine/threonine protein kinase